LRAWHYGASEIYVDGQLVQRFGHVSDSTDNEQEFNPRGLPIPIAFNTSGAFDSRALFVCSLGESLRRHRWVAGARTLHSRACD
jgi:hypothetical protein